LELFYEFLITKRKDLTTLTITVFNGVGNTKLPLSIYRDDTFLFTNRESKSLKEIMSLMARNFTLSKPLNLPDNIKSKRQIEYLDKYLPDNINNIALDIDYINSKEDLEYIINYFKSNNISCILCESKSFDNLLNFNIKGILRVQSKNCPNILKGILNKIQIDIKNKGEIDLTSANTVSYQAPTFKNKILYLNEDGYILNESDYIEILEPNKIEIKIDYQDIYSDVVSKSLDVFYDMGYNMTSSKMNESGSINFSHTSEQKSKGGYFWFSSNPFVMNHHIKSKSISIFNTIKQTKEGKEYLKIRTKEEQKSKLENIYSNYKTNLIVNERYLDFTKENKKEIVNDFINSDKGILKIKSPMGTAKSNAIELTIQEAHKRDLKVILVSNRVSVAKDFTDKYGIINYRDEKAIDYNGSLVVQYESLHRFTLNNYDIVIFDEFISLLLHHRANLTDNSNINAIKFKILLDNKKVLIADAFLTGYEDIFFENRDIFSIKNEYKDDIDIFEYKNKEYFLTSLLDRCKRLKENEHITCSFTSSNVLRVVEKELRDNNIKVVSLTAETSETTRDIIYNKFKENTHNSFQVLLFTPTLTVGVSNINNIPTHFHFDSSMSADVISSLQMIKRSRNTKEIHYYIAERQLYQDTNIDSINNLAQQNITTYYNRKDKTLLVDVDYNSGNLILTDLAKYINKIEAFYNILSNNHANAFRILSNYQFSKSALVISNIDDSYSLAKKVKVIQESIREDNIKLLENYSDVVWNPIELNDIKHKNTDLTEEEKMKVLLSSIQDKFSKEIPRDKLIELSKLEIESKYSFISKIKNTKLVLDSNDTYTKYLLSSALSKNLSSLQSSDKDHIKFLSYLLNFDKEDIKPWYSKKNIKEYKNSKGFENFLKKIGYVWVGAKLKIKEEIFDYLDYL